MRQLQISKECKDYVDSNSKLLEKKFKYFLQILTEQKIVHIKFVKKLIGTEFYELRISVENEHRIILFSVDNENLIEAKTIVFLNGFLKKNKKDYKIAIKIARKLLEKYKIG